jgi:hypothetical protein
MPAVKFIGPFVPQLVSTQPLTEMSTRNISWGGKDGWCIGLTDVPIVLKSGSLNILELSGHFQACTGIALHLKFIEALSYKPESREFDSRWSYWNFSLT